MDLNLIITLLILLFVLGGVLITFFVLHRQRRKVGNLSRDLGLELKGNKLSGQLDGRDYYAKLIPANKNSPPGIRFSIKTPITSPLSIVKEKAYHRFAKKIGLIQEVQVADLDFDKAFLIEGSNPTFVRTCLGDERLRSSIKALFQGEVKVVSLKIDDGEFQVHFSPFHWDKQGSKEFISTIPQTLLPLLQKIEQFHVPSFLKKAGTPASVSFLTAFAIFIAIDGFVAIVIATTKYIPLHNKIYYQYLIYFPLAYVLFIGLSYTVCRGQFRVLPHFMTQAIAALLGIPLLFCGGPVFINGHFDKGETIYREYPVMKKYIYRDKNGVKYYLRLHNVYDNKGNIKLRCNSTVYRLIHPGRSEVILFVKPGYLSHEWRNGYRVRY